MTSLLAKNVFPLEQELRVQGFRDMMMCVIAYIASNKVEGP
jgi:hypothetical protein